MSNPFKNKQVLNFHHADFDGAISGSCVSATLNNNSKSKAFSIGKVGDAVLENINNTDIILLTDISIYGEYLEKVSKEINENKLIIYDHHINQQTLETFSKFNAKSDSVLDKDVCGATIAWYKLMEHFPNNSKLQDLETIVYLSDVYDMWRLDNEDFEYAASINDLLDYKIGYTPDAFRERFLKNPDPFNLSYEEKMIIERKKIRHEKSLKQMENEAMLFDFKNHTFVLVEADVTDYTKMHFMNQVLVEEFVDMFIFKYTGTTQCSVRVPSTSKIVDLNDWFDEFGCIGHARAGGIGQKEFYKLQHILDSI